MVLHIYDDSSLMCIVCKLFSHSTSVVSICEVFHCLCRSFVIGDNLIYFRLLLLSSIAGSVKSMLKKSTSLWRLLSYCLLIVLWHVFHLNPYSIFCLVCMYNVRPISFFACEYQVFPRMFVGNTVFSLWFHGSFVNVSQVYTWPFVSGLYILSPSIHVTVLMAAPVQLHNTFWNQILMLPDLSFHSRLTCCFQSMWVYTFLDRKGWKWVGRSAT